MRANEFLKEADEKTVTINIPITITIPAGGDPSVSMPTEKEVDPSELDQNPVFVSPLQQELELKKAANGKESDVISDLTQTEITDDEDEIKVIQMQETDELAQLIRLLK